METRLIIENLEKIMAFEAVARLGSLHKASQELNISQPSLSVKIKQVEEIFNTLLLTRSSKGVKLTREGHRVHTFVKDVIHLSEELGATLSNTNDDQESGFLRLGIYESVARYFWPSFYNKFKKEFPQINVQLTTGRSSSLIEKLSGGLIDIAITIEAPHLPELSVRDVYQDCFSIYGHKKLLQRLPSKELKGSIYKISVDHLQQVNLITFSSALAENGKPLVQEMTKLNFPYKNISEVESFEIALEFCQLSLGLAVLPNQVAKKEFLKKQLFKVKIDPLVTLDFSKHKINASCLATNQNNPLHTLLLERLVGGANEFINK